MVINSILDNEQLLQTLTGRAHAWHFSHMGPNGWGWNNETITHLGIAFLIKVVLLLID